MSLTLGLTFIDCTNPYAGVVLLAIGVGSFGFASGGGFLANINEIGGSYAGMLFGLQNTVATLPGIIAPYLVGVITTHVSFGFYFSLIYKVKRHKTLFLYSKAKAKRMEYCILFIGVCVPVGRTCLHAFWQL
jgi:hypothetical protein